MKDNLNFFMEDYLMFLLMEDDLNFFQMENNIKYSSE